ncbi:MAG: hypothetical protein JNK82_35950 [Myxococcaceae bacterium]|nr:hypothetical protein [Myxococcaceae bacterium]
MSLVACGAGAPMSAPGGGSGTAGGTSGTAGFSGTAGGGMATAGFGGTAGGGTLGNAGGAASTVDCTPVVTELQGSGGCVLQLVGPPNCAQLDFDAQGFVELAWTTNTTFCEGPHRFLIGGHPADTWFTADNGVLWSLSSTNGSERSVGTASSYAMTRNIGGYVRLRKADLAGITTTTGQYHWFVAGFYDVDNGGSRSASRTFTVKP